MNTRFLIPTLAAAMLLTSCGNNAQQCTSTPNGIVIEKQRLLSLSFSMPSTVKMALAELSKFSTKNFDISLKFCNFIQQHDFFLTLKYTDFQCIYKIFAAFFIDF